MIRGKIDGSPAVLKRLSLLLCVFFRPRPPIRLLLYGFYVSRRLPNDAEVSMNVTLKQTQSSLDIAGIGTKKPPSDAERLIDFDPLCGLISIKGDAV